MKYSFGISSIFEKSFPVYCLFLCIVYLRRPSYLSLLFSGTLHSVGYIFLFLICFLLLFFLQLFLKPPQTTILPSCISFSWGWFWSLPRVQRYKPLSIVCHYLLQSALHSNFLSCYLMSFFCSKDPIQDTFYISFSCLRLLLALTVSRDSPYARVFVKTNESDPLTAYFTPGGLQSMGSQESDTT